jgi:hypothetical protein
VKKNPFLRTTIKREWSSTRQQWEYVERVFDKASRTYRETYRDLQTGQVTFEKAGSLCRSFDGSSTVSSGRM